VSRIWSGVHPQLEEYADELLRQSNIGIKRAEERGGVLTPYMLAARRAREVYPASGTPDPAMRAGLFHRAYNSGRPDLNSRDGIAAAAPGRLGRGLQLQTGTAADKETRAAARAETEPELKAW
jgi:hypothetical protein